MGIVKFAGLTVLAGLVFCQLLSSVNSYNAGFPPDVYGRNVNLASNSSHHLALGQVFPGDKQLFRQIVKEPSSLFRVVTRDIHYPGNGTTGYYIISAIRALDQNIKGEGGYAFLTRGGIGYKNASLHLKSQRSRGFNFIVEIWGHWATWKWF